MVPGTLFMRQIAAKPGKTGLLERTDFYGPYSFRLPRQGIPFPLRPLYLLDFRKFRVGSWDTFGTVEDCDIAQTTGAISQSGRMHRWFINVR